MRNGCQNREVGHCVEVVDRFEPATRPGQTADRDRGDCGGEDAAARAVERSIGPVLGRAVRKVDDHDPTRRERDVGLQRGDPLILCRAAVGGVPHHSLHGGGLIELIEAPEQVELGDPFVQQPIVHREQRLRLGELPLELGDLVGLAARCGLAHDGAHSGDRQLRLRGGDLERHDCLIEIDRRRYGSEVRAELRGDGLSNRSGLEVEVTRFDLRASECDLGGALRRAVDEHDARRRVADGAGESPHCCDRGARDHQGHRDGEPAPDDRDRSLRWRQGNVGDIALSRSSGC